MEARHQELLVQQAVNEEVDHHRLKLLMLKNPEKFAELDWIFPKLARWVKLLRQAEFNVAERHRLAAEAAASPKSKKEPNKAADGGSLEIESLSSLSLSTSSSSTASVQDDGIAESLSCSSLNADRRSHALKQKLDEQSETVSPCGLSALDLLQTHGLRDAFDSMIRGNGGADATDNETFPSTSSSKFEALSRTSLSSSSVYCNRVSASCMRNGGGPIHKSTTDSKSVTVFAKSDTRPIRSSSNNYRSLSQEVLLAAHSSTIVASPSTPSAADSAANAGIGDGNLYRRITNSIGIGALPSQQKDPSSVVLDSGTQWSLLPSNQHSNLSSQSNASTSAYANNSELLLSAMQSPSVDGGSKGAKERTQPTRDGQRSCFSPQFFATASFSDCQQQESTPDDAGTDLSSIALAPDATDANRVAGASSAVAAFASVAKNSSRLKRKVAAMDEMDSVAESSLSSAKSISEALWSQMALEIGRNHESQDEIKAKTRASFSSLSSSSSATSTSVGMNSSASTYRHSRLFSNPTDSGHVSSDNVAPNSAFSYVSEEEVAAKAASASVAGYFHSMHMPMSEEFLVEDEDELYGADRSPARGTQSR